LGIRAVLMTSFAFILGLVPLVIASGAAEASQRTAFSCPDQASDIEGLYISLWVLRSRRTTQLSALLNR
jgi:hypothetical protein